MFDVHHILGIFTGIILCFFITYLLIISQSDWNIKRGFLKWLNDTVREGIRQTQRDIAVASARELINDLASRGRDPQGALRRSLVVSEVTKSPEERESDKKLYEFLKRVRNAIAKEEKVSRYIIFHNKSLQKMSAQHPTDYESFLRIHGVGEVKAEKYGLIFIQAIKDFQDGSPEKESGRYALAATKQ